MILRVKVFILLIVLPWACTDDSEPTKDTDSANQPNEPKQVAQEEAWESCEPDLADLTKMIEARTFKVRVPEDWIFREHQGIDTYVGELAGPTDTIVFDQGGLLSFGTLSDVEKNRNTVTFVECTINSIPAIIHKEEIPNWTNKDIRLSAYIDSGDSINLNRLYVLDPVEEETILNIFKSHQFK